ncbi:expansin EXLX1 family cellulose-binding protein [Streptomyces sp. N50]|uniref:expansin EXLX1 family cellulose-binding protein n=1 Tax=Streptomyces sp. N50 TaxID=3081765 RepID=UPI0029621235|nr:expansin EXLX1 family cellulose-binding protein [Streptomyces sp. N50]WOX07490.1 expansin EXLX1 family cellulose-binding protein [Streptomyces sp. N50]
MSTTRQVARERRRKRRLMLGTLTLVAASVVVCLVMALLPDDKSDAKAAASTTVAAGEATADAPQTLSTPSAKGKASPSPSASRSAAASPKPSRTTVKKKPVPAKTTPSANSGSTTASLAGRIKPGTDYQGVATAYEAGVGDGACGFGPSPTMMIGAMNTTDYETARACGAYVHVRAANGRSVTVRITNECPLPCAPGQIDLSHEAFSQLGDLHLGRIAITWNLVSPANPGSLSVRYKTGSSQYWCAVQVLNHRNPVAALEVRTSGGWRQLGRTSYNYFLSGDGTGCGGAIRITDIYGQRLTVNGIAIRPNVVQPTSVQFAQH